MKAPLPEPTRLVDDSELIARSERLAEEVLVASISDRRPSERRQGDRIARLLEDAGGVRFVLALTDEVLRIRDPRRAARHFQAVIDELSSPRFLGPFDRVALRLGGALATRLPTLVMPLVSARVRAELSPYVIDSEPRTLRRHLAIRREQGIGVNLNLLGEAVLGDDEAALRLTGVLALLERPDVDYVSVKISAVCAQLNVAAFETEVDRIAMALRQLYAAASRHQPAKFVNLDMEEYHDLELTLAAFTRVLGEESFGGLDAGIVLQAYLPDSLDALNRLCHWARDRHRRHGGSVKVRIVKGANLAMERVEAAMHGWPSAPWETKAEVDAHYKRMLDVALDSANLGALRVGVASHNLLELAWALTLAETRNLRSMVEVEMLEGMAPSTARAVRRVAGDLLLYAPVAPRRDRESVIAYLVRRFDENTGPENFLRHQYQLAPRTTAWAAERARFEAAVVARHQPVIDSRRVVTSAERRSTAGDAPFANVPDTDWSIAANRQALDRAYTERARSIPVVVPVVVADRVIGAPATQEGLDPAVAGLAAYRWVPADHAVIAEALNASVVAGHRWRDISGKERAAVLRRVGDELAARRFELIACMAVDGGKTVGEADPEVSEAVDFASYYAAGVGRLQELGAEGAQFTPFGTVVVIPPWNFPLAIPAGGLLAALAAGNAVILKPAPESVATAWALVEACWAAGVPRDLLQFVPCVDGPAATTLVTDPRVGAVILTGAWETARMFLGWRPDLALRAETSGKNALVITATADLDSAVADLVRSAFGHSGQKCSAASLAIVETSVCDDPRFLRQLADAVRTLRPGPGWDVSTTMGPLIHPPEAPLDRALRRLDPGERWLVKPEQLDHAGCLWSPGVKLGVQPGSWFHTHECFGPVLGVMRADDLGVATAWQNMTPYGLTAGLHSLDPTEIDWWLEHAEAGNLYVNRHITGAIVRRQPFGGWKRSVVGPGAKAGGPNYLLNLGTWRAEFGGDADEFAAAVRQVLETAMAPSDPSGLGAEANLFRYRLLERVLLRAALDVSDADLGLAVAAGRAVGVDVEVSSPVQRPHVDIVEDDAALVRRLKELRVDKIRLGGNAGAGVRLAAHDAGLWLDDTSIVGHPQLEALRWVREQAISLTRHRHGDITGRFDVSPAPAKLLRAARK